MANETVLEHVLDVNRHGGTEVPSEQIAPPKVGGNYVLDENVIDGTDLCYFRAPPCTLWIDTQF